MVIRWPDERYAIEIPAHRDRAACCLRRRLDRLEWQETLEIQVGLEKCEADAEFADAPFDGRVVPKKGHRDAAAAAN
jgi:hypothetical protein